MALIHETGIGLANAESYVSVAESDAYFAARANENWDNVEDKEAALRKATDYIEQAYHGRWKGYRATSEQRLSWPRRSIPLEDDDGYSFIPHTIVPERVRQATAELALISASNELAPNLERAQSQVTIGEISVTYDPASPQTMRYPRINMLLSPYLKGGSMNMVPLIRG